MAEMTTIQAVRGEEFPRVFTKDVTNFGDWRQLEPLFQELERQVAVIATTEDLEAWLLRGSELDAAIGEEGSRRYIAMTCQTDDREREQAYLDFLENVEPQLKVWGDRLCRLYLECPARKNLDRQRFEVLDRRTENEVRLFRDENVPLQTDDARLSQQYQKICGGQTVMWRGEERTLQQLSPYMEENDRSLREEAWRVVAGRRLQDHEELNKIFNQMIELRDRMARNACFDNFRDYQHAAYNRFDYTPADAETFHQAVEQEVAPLLAGLRGQRRAKLGVDTLRPWDLSVDPMGSQPLKPFAKPEELEAGCANVFERLNQSLADEFAIMRQRGLLDLGSRKGKAPGGYQSTLEEVRLPFIFMNAAGTQRDVMTLLHEGGHAFHAFAARQQPLVGYRSAPMEFCEVASMSMEMFGLDQLDVFYRDTKDARRAKRRHLEEIIDIFPWIATIDAFQHWIYLNPGHTVADREAKWLELHERFSPGLDWSGLEPERRSLWQRQLHLFQCPFYYIEYGIAQLGALQLWLRYRENPASALKDYRQALALGGSRPLPELFQTAGIRFDFSAATLRPIMKAIGETLAEPADA